MSKYTPTRSQLKELGFEPIHESSRDLRLQKQNKSITFIETSQVFIIDTGNKEDISPKGIMDLRGFINTFLCQE